jgi:starch phosphorylase
MFLFGMRTPDVAKARPVYNARECAAADPEISAALQLIKDGTFSPGDPLRYEPILRSLLDYNDHYMLLADLRSYSDAQDRVDATYRNPEEWGRMSLVNIARSGLFSSDRAVAEYARNIWHVAPVMFG